MIDLCDEDHHKVKTLFYNIRSRLIHAQNLKQFDQCKIYSTQLLFLIEEFDLDIPNMEMTI